MKASRVFSRPFISSLPCWVKPLVFLLAASLLASCSPGNNSQPALVVDVLAVARALGREDVMNQQLEQAKKSLNNQLADIGSKLKRQLEDKQKELEKAPNNNKQAVREELDQMAQQANLKLSKAKELANQKALQYRNQLILDFRKEIMAVAGDIAKRRKASIIYAADTELLWYSDQVDITDEVIGKMRAQKETNDSGASSLGTNAGESGSETPSIERGPANSATESSMTGVSGQTDQSGQATSK